MNNQIQILPMVQEWKFMTELINIGFSDENFSLKDLSSLFSLQCFSNFPL